MADIQFEKGDDSIPEGHQALYRDDVYLATTLIGQPIALPLANRVLVHPRTYEQMMNLRRVRER